MTADDRCHRCDRLPTAWRHSSGPLRFTTSADRVAAMTANPSVCWGGEECAAHAVDLDWRRRALEAELRCNQMERELCEARADLAGVRETLRVDRATTPDYWKRAYIAANGLACDFRKKLEKIDVAVQEMLAATKEHPHQTLFEALKWACAVMPEEQASVVLQEQREAVKKRIVAALEGLRKVVER